MSEAPAVAAAKNETAAEQAAATADHEAADRAAHEAAERAAKEAAATAAAAAAKEAPAATAGTSSSPLSQLPGSTAGTRSIEPVISSSSSPMPRSSLAAATMSTPSTKDLAGLQQQFRKQLKDAMQYQQALSKGDLQEAMEHYVRLARQFLFLLPNQPFSVRDLFDILASPLSLVAGTSDWLESTRSAIEQRTFTDMEDVLENLLTAFAPNASAANLRYRLESLSWPKTETLYVYLTRFINLVSRIYRLKQTEPAFFEYLRTEAKHFYKGLTRDSGLLYELLRLAGSNFDRVDSLAGLRRICTELDQRGLFLQHLGQPPVASTKRTSFLLNAVTDEPDSTPSSTSDELTARLEAATLAMETQASICAAVTERNEKQSQQIQDLKDQIAEMKTKVKGQQQQSQPRRSGKPSSYGNRGNGNPSFRGDGRCHRCGHTGHMISLCPTDPQDFLPGFPRNGRTGQPFSQLPEAASFQFKRLEQQLQQLMQLQQQQQQQPQPSPQYYQRPYRPLPPSAPSMTPNATRPAPGMAPPQGQGQQQQHQQVNDMGYPDDYEQRPNGPGPAYY